MAKILMAEKLMQITLLFEPKIRRMLIKKRKNQKPKNKRQKMETLRL
jgi:hypothetical protein